MVMDHWRGSASLEGSEGTKTELRDLVQNQVWMEHCIQRRQDVRPGASCSSDSSGTYRQY